MRANDGQEPSKKRAPYTRPSVVDYGSLAKLTRTGTGSGGDGGAVAGMMMVCL